MTTWEAFFNGSDPRSPLVSAYLFEHLFYAHLYFPDVPDESVPPCAIAHTERRAHRRDPDERPPVRRPGRRTLLLPPSANSGDACAQDARPLRAERREARAPSRTVLRLAVGGARVVDARSSEREPLRDLRGDSDTRAIPVSPRRRALPRADVHSRPRVPRTSSTRRHRRALSHLLFTPESDPAITDPGYLAQIAPDLELPAEKGQSIAALSPGFDAKELRYLRAEVPHARPRTLADVWHGDGSNPDAVLTVFRHYDNAFVLRGAVGGMPKTAWVLDYPTFERMYYDLVAGFDVTAT